jgi:hypothetical protein
MTTSTLSKIQQVKAIKDIGNREWSTRRHGCNSRSSFLFRGSTSTLERCGCHTGLTNATKAHHILRCKLPPQRPSSLSTKGFLKAEPAFTNLGHTSTTELEAPKHHKINKQQVSRYQSHKSRSRDTREPKTQGPSSKREEKSNRFSEDIDQGLLLRFSKDQELW